jgi:5'-3' exonuclease
MDIFSSKIFIETINKLPRNLGLGKNTNPIILVGKDCKRSDIWRNELFPAYKGTRGMDTSFMGGPFFKMVYEEQLFIQSGAIKILKHPKLEADDCIALSVKHLLKTNPNSKIYIVTSDKDYLQLACPQVQLFNLSYKKLTDQKSCTGNSECDLFCKLVTGDSSDNIPSVFPKCGIKTALKYYENKSLFEKKLAESELYQKQYLLNKKIIDFNEIPNDLAEEFMKVWENDLKI